MLCLGSKRSRSSMGAVTAVSLTVRFGVFGSLSSAQLILANQNIARLGGAVASPALRRVCIKASCGGLGLICSDQQIMNGDVLRMTRWGCVLQRLHGVRSTH